MTEFGFRVLWKIVKIILGVGRQSHSTTAEVIVQNYFQYS